jgi:hypothetical protein
LPLERKNSLPKDLFIATDAKIGEEERAGNICRSIQGKNHNDNNKRTKSARRKVLARTLLLLGVRSESRLINKRLDDYTGR